jgi:putative FmdB family regulatory protein
MPIYEYKCDDCGTRYERLVLRKSQEIACPQCHSGRKTLQLSVFGTTGKANGSSDAPSACSLGLGSCCSGARDLH